MWNTIFTNGHQSSLCWKRWQIWWWFIEFEEDTTHGLSTDTVTSDLGPWMTLNCPRSKLLTPHYIVSRVMPYVATCCLVLWYMVWNRNSIGQIHVPQTTFLLILKFYCCCLQFNILVCYLWKYCCRCDIADRQLWSFLSIWRPMSHRNGTSSTLRMT